MQKPLLTAFSHDTGSHHHPSKSPSSRDPAANPASPLNRVPKPSSYETSQQLITLLNQKEKQLSHVNQSLLKTLEEIASHK